MAGNISTPGASVVERALTILECFDLRHPALTLTEISEKSNLPVSTTKRLLAQLGRWGAVERLVDNRYRVGIRLWNIGIMAPQQRGIREAAMPMLYDLYGATQETVQLVVLDGRQALCVEKVAGPNSAPTSTEVGGHLPLHATAVGKCILAYSPKELVQEVINTGLTRVTPFSIVQPARLVAELRRIRQGGVAYSKEEMSVGAVSVAAPVLGPDDVLLGALGIVVRATKRVDHLAPAVITAARAIARFSG
ncbi:IclR family transcriptional regulator [Streptomyces sp. NPDC088387]|uniref:IclR family transcriptional regulator n=1 Tax=Streptomyces sp. NPDC088387 TaxID=3365859 RepID=UPI0037FFBF01